jgi:hypothetical protein
VHKVKKVGPAFSYSPTTQVRFPQKKILHRLEKSKGGEKKKKRFPFVSKPSNENPLQSTFQIFQI